jgi:hypothetical protein
VSASKSGVIVSGSVPSVATGSTNNISLSFTETFTINVKRNSTNQTTAIVIITGGPTSTTITVTGNNTSGRGQSGNYTMSNVPIGSGYTIKAYANPCSSVSNPKSKTTSSVTIASGQGTINVSYSSSTCPVP